MNRYDEYREMLNCYVEIYNTKRNSCTDNILEELRENIFDYSMTYKFSAIDILKPQFETNIYKLPEFDEAFKILLEEVIEDYISLTKEGII